MSVLISVERWRRAPAACLHSSRLERERRKENDGEELRRKDIRTCIYAHHVTHLNLFTSKSCPLSRERRLWPSCTGHRGRRPTCF